MAKKLKTIFKHRQTMFEKNTDSIFTALTPVTDGIVEYLNLKDEISQGQLAWTNVLHQELEGLVTMIGLIQYPPGAEFDTANGEKMVVSEDTAEYFNRIIRFTLPYELVDRGTTEDVVKFLQELEREGDDHVELSGDADQLILADFNYDDLTEEQKAAIMADRGDESTLLN